MILNLSAADDRILKALNELQDIVSKVLKTVCNKCQVTPFLRINEHRSEFDRHKVFLHPYNNNNIYLLQLGCHLVAVVILHVNKT